MSHRKTDLVIPRLHESAKVVLGARIGITAVLHTWGSAMTHHPHLHMIVPGGGLSLDGKKWLACRPGFFLPGRRSWPMAPSAFERCSP